MSQYVTFYLGEESFAINILIIREIGKLAKVIPVPEAAAHIVGIMNFRGQILTLIDPHEMLEQKSELVLEERSLIILKTTSELKKSKYILEHWEDIEGYQTNDPLAIVIDNMGSVLSNVSSEDIKILPSNIMGTRKEFLNGIIRKNDQLVNLVSLENLISRSFQHENEMETAVA